jgi:hypothetical protein
MDFHQRPGGPNSFLAGQLLERRQYMQGQETARDSKLLALAEHLRSMRFNVKTGVKLDDQPIAIMAQRARIQIERVCLAEEFFMVSHFDHLDRALLSDYSRKCFKYALRNRRIPLPWGWPAVHFATCYAVAMVPAAHSALTSSLTRSEPVLRWWYSHEFPIVWDLAEGRLYYPRITADIFYGGHGAQVQERVALEVLVPVA